MVDNVAVTPGAGATIATDDVGGVQYQRVKIDLGGDGAASPLVRGQLAAAASLPVVLASDQSAVPITDNAGSITVDGTVAISGTVTIDSELPTASALADAAANPTTPTVGSANLVFNGATWDRARGDTANGLDVDVTRLPALAAGTNNIGDVDILSIAAGDNNIGNVDIVTLPNVTLAAGTNTNEVVGDAAHGAAVAGNPLLNGYEGRTTDGTAVTNGQAVRALADTLGKQVVLQGAVPDLHTNGKANYTTTTAADVIAAAGAGVRIAVTSILVTNAHATVGTKVEIRDGTTVKIQGQAAAAGGGFALNAGGTPLFISTANTAVTARCATTGADVDVNVSGYKLGN